MFACIRCLLLLLRAGIAFLPGCTTPIFVAQGTANRVWTPHFRKGPLQLRLVSIRSTQVSRNDAIHSFGTQKPWRKIYAQKIWVTVWPLKMKGVQTFLTFIPIWGRLIRLDSYFQLGWNHHLVFFDQFCTFIYIEDSMEGPVCLGMYVGVCRPHHALCFLFMRPEMGRRLAYRVQAKRKACCQVSLSSGHRRYPNILEAPKSCATYNFLHAATPNVVSAAEACAYQNHVASLHSCVMYQFACERCVVP